MLSLSLTLSPPFTLADRIKRPADLAAYDFVITTYEVVRSEHAAHVKSTANASSVSARSGGGVLFGLRWWRVVLDEAHCIRNAETGVSKACCELRAVHRWCVSGTPMQNSVGDLYALLRFLRVGRYGESLAAFKELTAKGGAICRPLPCFSGLLRPSPTFHRAGTGSNEMRSLLEVLMMRRLKGDTFGGRPLLTLPPKEVTVVTGELTPTEREAYRSLESHAKRGFLRILEEGGGVSANYIHVLALLTRLRQACDSPRLVTAAVQAAAEAAEAAAEAEGGDGPATEAQLSRATEMMAGGGEATDCPICMDVITRIDGVLTACGHAYCRECLGEFMHRSTAHATADDDANAAKCPLCRSSLDPSAVRSLRSLLPAPACDDVTTDDVASTAVDAAASVPVESSKTRLVLSAIQQMLERDGAQSKCLIFSCYTKFLDELATALAANRLRHARLDGSMRIKERERQIAAFHAPSVPVMLMPLKCGVGLNLTLATSVILCEPWWNPFVEEQARSCRVTTTM